MINQYLNFFLSTRMMVRYVHAPEQGNTTDDLENTQQTRDTSEACVMSTASDIRLTRRQDHDIGHGTGSRDRAEKNVQS